MTLPRWIRAIGAFINGMWEFRRAFTTRYNDYRLYEAYDKGRDLAHAITFRRFES